MDEMPHAIEYNGSPICWCGEDHNPEAALEREMDAMAHANLSPDQCPACIESRWLLQHFGHGPHRRHAD